MWEKIAEERRSRYAISLYIMESSKLEELYNETRRSRL